MVDNVKMTVSNEKNQLGRTPSERGPLGQAIWEARKRLGLTLRQVEEASGISNGYLSQLENGDIRNPSPQILFKLSEAINVEYELLMELAGHIKKSETITGKRKGRLPTFAKEDLSDEEEAELLNYLTYIRMRDGKKDEKR